MNRPHVFINAAMSADGKISTRMRRQIRISGDPDFERVDRLKAGVDAVMIGVGTMLADDPSLTVKNPDRQRERVKQGEPPNPARIVVDSRARTPLDADLFQKGEGERIIAISRSAPRERVRVLEEKATIIVAGEDRVDLPMLFDQLYERGVRTLMVEGGATLNYSLIREDLVDELYVFIGNMIIGGTGAPTLVDGEGFLEQDIRGLELVDCQRMGDGALLHWRFIH